MSFDSGKVKIVIEKQEELYRKRADYLAHEVRDDALEISLEILKTLKTAKLSYEEAYGILQFVVDRLEYERSFIHLDIVRPIHNPPAPDQEMEDKKRYQGL